MFILQIIFIFSEEVSIMFTLNLFGYPFYLCLIEDHICFLIYTVLFFIHLW